MKKFIIVIVFVFLIAILISFNYLLWDREKQLESYQDLSDAKNLSIDTLGEKINTILMASFVFLSDFFVGFPERHAFFYELIGLFGRIYFISHGRAAFFFIDLYPVQDQNHDVDTILCCVIGMKKGPFCKLQVAVVSGHQIGDQRFDLEFLSADNRVACPDEFENIRIFFLGHDRAARAKDVREHDKPELFHAEKQQIRGQFVHDEHDS